jgi:transcriptional regulator with XRE-family HTH domain
MAKVEANGPVEKAFGQRIRQLRKEKKLTQGELAGISGLHRNYISDTERGRRNISLLCMSKLAKGLECEIKDFFE